jgi:hypothetical protein
MIGRYGNFPSLEDKIPEDKILGTAKVIRGETARQGTEVIGECAAHILRLPSATAMFRQLTVGRALQFVVLLASTDSR